MTATFSVIDGALGGAPMRLPAPQGARILDIVAPETPGAAVQVDGHWILRAQWGHELRDGEHLDVHLLPAGNDGRKALRFILTIAASVYIPGLGLSAAGTAAALAGATLAINALLPLRPPGVGGLATNDSPTYSTSISGNRAALYEPIPVGYGRMRSLPPFGADPYQEFDNTTNDQYYYALLCVGMGQFVFESIQLDDTALDHFADVEYAILPPGTPPTLVLANVVTSVEVSEIELNAARSSPAIAACRGGLTATHVGFDVVFPGGLGDASGGTVTDASVDVRFDWRPIDDWGNPLGAWETLAVETITENLTSPVRRSFKYALPPSPSYRPEVRVIRTTPRDDDPLIRNDVFWTGLRAYLEQPAPLAADATYVEVKMRATEQLNGLSQRRLGVIWRRKVYTWDPDAGWSAEPVETRNPAWAIVDKLKDSVYGNGLPDARIDLETFYALAQTWDERQDHLDIVFEAAVDSDEADQIMARAGRARCFWRNGVRTIVRDEPQAMAAAAFSSRDIVPGSVSLSMNTDASQVPDGIAIEYFSHAGWDWETVMCPAPGVVTPTRPETMRVLGITGSKQAEREGLYEAAARVKRRTSLAFTTELQGLLPAYGSEIVCGLPLRGWGQSGDVVSWDVDTLTMVLTEPPAWQSGVDFFITLTRNDGSVHDSIEVTPGGTDYTVILAEAPDFTPSTDDARRERTRYILGGVSEHRRTMLCTGIRPQEMRDDGALLIEISAINDDQSVHEADLALLPESGEIQDPIDSPNEEGPPGDVFIAYLTTHSVSDDAPASGGTAGVLLRLKTDGVLQFVKTYTGPGQTKTITNQWIIGSPVDPSDTADFDVYASVLSGSLDSGTVDTWLDMGTQREFAISVSGDGNSQAVSLRVKFRDGSGLVQAEATINMSCSIAEFGGG